MTPKRKLVISILVPVVLTLYLLLTNYGMYTTPNKKYAVDPMVLDSLPKVAIWTAAQVISALFLAAPALMLAWNLLGRWLFEARKMTYMQALFLITAFYIVSALVIVDLQ